MPESFLSQNISRLNTDLKAKRLTAREYIALLKFYMGNDIEDYLQQKAKEK